MPDTLTPITREESYLAAIAGEDVTAPDPICRKEEFLAAIDGHIGDVESDVSKLQTQVPASAAGDSGKVLTAGSTAGTATWANVPKELPASLGTAGQVLTVNAGATGVEWATPSVESIPTIIIDGEYAEYELQNVTLTEIQAAEDVYCNIVMDGRTLQGVLNYGSIFGVSSSYAFRSYPTAAINSVAASQYVYNMFSVAGIMNTDGTLDQDHLYFYESSTATIPVST